MLSSVVKELEPATVYLFLFAYNGCEFGVDNTRIQLATHQGGAFVVFDVAVIDRFRQFDFFTKSLLLEIPCEWKCYQWYRNEFTKYFF